MDCDVSREQLWSWVDRDAPELDEHLAGCSSCRRRTESIRRKMRVIAAGSAVVIPDKVGPYTIKRLIGEGGQALVYEAEQPDPRRPVALKVLKGGRFASEKLVEHFRRESQALAHLQHPGIATIYEAGHTDEGLHYFAMELVDGVPLNTYVRKHDLTLEKRLELFRGICRAVGYAHQRGVIHRDLKPSNIIVEADAKPKILDFGLARLIRAEHSSTRTATRSGLIAGTPRYMSPEQAHGQSREIDPRSDVYSLGVILYELLTDRAPHDITDFTPESLQALYEEAPRRPSSVNRSVSRELDTIVLKALEKSPERRYRSVVELADDIRRFQSSEPIQARPPSRVYRMRKGLVRHRRWAALAAVVLVVAAAAGLNGRRSAERASHTKEQARLAVLKLRRDLLRGTPDDAVISRARDAPSVHPGLHEAVLLSAQALCLSGGPHLAVPYLKARLEEDPDQWPYRVLLEEINNNHEVTPSGRVEADREAAHLDSAESWYLRSFATLDVDKALARAEEAVRRDSGYPPALATLALLYPIVGDSRRALDHATTLVDRNHDPGLWSRYKVELLFGLSRFSEALVECDQLVADDPDNRTSYLLRARTLRRLKRYEEAVRDFTTAIEIGGRDTASATWPYYHRGTLLWMLGQPDKAISDYSRAYRSLAHTTHANARLFLIRRETGRSDEARDGLVEARRRSGADRWLATIFACLAGELSPAELVAAAADAVQLCEASYYAGEVSLMQGQEDAARIWFQACVDTGVEGDPSERWEPMSEYELAEWRLSQLQ